MRANRLSICKTQRFWCIQCSGLPTYPLITKQSRGKSSTIPPKSAEVACTSNSVSCQDGHISRVFDPLWILQKGSWTNFSTFFELRAWWLLRLSLPLDATTKLPDGIRRNLVLHISAELWEVILHLVKVAAITPVQTHLNQKCTGTSM